MSRRENFERKVFATSRLAEFCSVSELEKQTGHPADHWPLVILKELLDNAIDAAEAAGVAPVIDIRVENGRIIVADEGAGIAASTIEKLIDYNIRVSDKEAYVSPTRGAQGNALKTIIAMPFALDGESGETIIETQGLKHRIIFEIDPIRREPKVAHRQVPGTVKNGTRISVRWPDSAGGILVAAKTSFLPFAADFAVLNPHLTLRVCWGDSVVSKRARNVGWQKWKPTDATAAHWYTSDRFERLIAAHIAHDEDNGGQTTVRDFIGIFRGLSGTAKQSTILDRLGVKRQTLATFFNEGSNRRGVKKLHALMMEMSNGVKPKDLGVIGEKHLERTFIEAGAITTTFKYQPLYGTNQGLPWVVEAAFAVRSPDDGIYGDRVLMTGVNFSATMIDPFRCLGESGESLAALLSNQYADADEPVMVCVHLVCPRLSWTDRGKTTLMLGDLTFADDDITLEEDIDEEGVPAASAMGAAIVEAVTKTTAAWAKQRLAEIKNANALNRRLDRLARSQKVTTKQAAYQVMAAAYKKASTGANGETLPANARQIMYAARKSILQATDESELNDEYFTQVLLPNYIAEHRVNWDVVYDDRGHFIEPHGGPRIGIGHLAVRKYLNSIHAPMTNDGSYSPGGVVMRGPQGSFSAVLFIEKEGFSTLFEKVRIGDRFDIAVMSTKGMSVTAARELVERLCGEMGVRLFILHDFDKDGFSIKSTLHRDTRRYQFESEVEAYDIGLRLEDVIALGIEHLSEPAAKVKASREKRRENVIANGATEEEAEFLLDRRVELNALTSAQLVAFVEKKLIEHGVTKVVPDEQLLTTAYEWAMRNAKVQEVVEDAIAKMEEEEIEPPEDLMQQVTELLKKKPTLAWDDAVGMIARKKK
jgi:DNA topoisomerase VI subunit B